MKKRSGRIDLHSECDQHTDSVIEEPNRVFTMNTIPLAQAKKRFSELISQVEAGETVFVTRRGKPVVQLVKYAESVVHKQSEHVQQTFARLRELREGLTLEGDLKSIVREGLTLEAPPSD